MLQFCNRNVKDFLVHEKILNKIQFSNTNEFVFLFLDRAMALETLKNARYYNKPDGEDYVGKMIATNKYMLMAAIPIAFHDVVMITKPKGVLATLARYGKWIGPAIGMASAFTTATYMACNLRKKDDK
jgi:hypothetical protein